MNAFAHCFGCHQKLGSNPDDFQAWALEKLGQQKLDILREKRENINLAKDYKKNLKDVGKHYKLELEAIEAARAGGASGRIDFIGYA